MLRAFYGHVKKRFDELDIEIPFPHHIVYLGVDQQGQAPAAQVKIKPPAGRNRNNNGKHSIHFRMVYNFDSSVPNDVTHFTKSLRLRYGWSKAYRGCQETINELDSKLIIT
jgi:hypothetical protein